MKDVPERDPGTISVRPKSLIEDVLSLNYTVEYHCGHTWTVSRADLVLYGKRAIPSVCPQCYMAGG